MEALYVWYKGITEYIQNNGLTNLSEYEVDGKRIFNSFTDLTRSKGLLKEFSYSDFKHADDLNYLSQDLIYSIAILEILHPKINNALKEGGTYHQNLEDHLYLRYASYGLQTIYSFWDRLGDFLDFFLILSKKAMCI